MGRLDGKVAIVTGAAQGMGATTAQVFAREGARVALADMADDKGTAVAEAIGESAFYRRCDISRSDDWETLVADVLARWGRIDVLINNASILGPQATLLDVQEADFERVVKTNLLGTWHGIKAVGRQMVSQGNGSIVNIMSAAALHCSNGLGAYAASKWGLRGMTKVAAMELGPKGIRVNGVFPGGIATPMSGVDHLPRDEVNKGMAGQPIPRIGEAEEVANTSLFLASDESSYLTGAEIAVDGGLTIGPYHSFLPGAPDGLSA